MHLNFNAQGKELSIELGKVTQLIGFNGAGKTIVLNSIFQLFQTRKEYCLHFQSTVDRLSALKQIEKYQPDVIIFDDIESNMHLSNCRTYVAAILRAAPEDVKLIFSTHNPEILSSVLSLKDVDVRMYNISDASIEDIKIKELTR